jgi:hypothetical protein
MRPARNAARPASQACFMAVAIRTGSSASAMPVLSSTPSTPSSKATETSLAVPTPASTMMGTWAASLMRAMLRGFRIPRPLPMGAPRGMTAVAPASSRRRARTGSSLV